MKCCLPLGTFWHAHSFAVSPRIYARFVRSEAAVLGEHGDFLKMVLTPFVRLLRSLECQGVEDSSRNFTYIPAKPQPRHN